MALMKCNECGTEVSDKAAVCMRCGAPVAAAPEPTNAIPVTVTKSKVFKWWLWIPLGLIATPFVVGSMLPDTPERREKQSRREAISACWEEQKRKSLDPSLQRFIAGACEKMESDFRQKFHLNP